MTAPAHAIPPYSWLSAGFFFTAKRCGVRLTNDVLCVSVQQQRLWHLVPQDRRTANRGSMLYRPYVPAAKPCLCSTSRFGIGQVEGSNCTPLGLHCIAQKIGGGTPVGTVFKSRRPVGFTWRGLPHAKITTRILWLEGLETGFNRGGRVDSRARFIYIHGTGDETGLGRPASCGCIHLAARDLVPLYDSLPLGTLVWIER
jgi:hypothetical protein